MALRGVARKGRAEAWAGGGSVGLFLLERGGGSQSVRGRAPAAIPCCMPLSVSSIWLSGLFSYAFSSILPHDSPWRTFSDLKEAPGVRGEPPRLQGCVQYLNGG